MNFASKPFHYLQKTIKPESGQIFQVLWNPQASNFLAIYGERHISVWNSNSGDRLGLCQKGRLDGKKSASLAKKKSESSQQMKEEDGEEQKDTSLKDLVDYYCEGFGYWFKNYTSWVGQTGFLGVWNQKNVVITSKEKIEKSPPKRDQGSTMGILSCWR